MITASAMSSARSALVGVSILGGIHINAQRPDWTVSTVPRFER